MKQLVIMVIVLVLAFIAPGCREPGVIAEGGNFRLTVEQLRFEISKLGPSAQYKDTFDMRYAVVMNLATRSFLADEAESLGYGGDQVERAEADAEKQAVAGAYLKWKVDNAVMLPRIMTKPWIGKLDRRLRLEDVTFLVYPVAVEARNEIRGGELFGDFRKSIAGREDVHVTDLDWKIWKDMPREVANIVFRLDVGEVSEIVPGADGYHLFYVAEDEPFGISMELLSARSKRFVSAMEEERLLRDLKRDLEARYHVKYHDAGVSDGLKAFAIAFSGERPSEALMNGVVATYPLGEVTVGDLFGMYFRTAQESRPYVGDYHALCDFALEMIMPDLEALAGFEAHLDRSRDVRFAKRKAREDVLTPFMEDSFRTRITVSAEDIENYYEERKNDLFEPGRYHVARILVSTEGAAGRAYRQIMMGSDFADVAESVSEDEASAARGGDLGWLNEGLLAAYDSVVAGMQPGEVSAPFETNSGVEILKLLERIGRRHLSLEEATPDIRMYITNTRANEMLANFVEKKRDEEGFRVDEDLLRQVRLPLPAYQERQYGRGEDLDESREKSPTPLPKMPD